jgi:hypothetical protein
MLKLILITLVLVASLTASPVLNPDSVTIPDNHPGLGVEVMAIPNTSWTVWFNDNRDRGDYDFNDLVIGVSFGSIIGNSGNVGAETIIMASVSAHGNLGYVEDSFLPIPFFGETFKATAGSIVTFRMQDTNTGDVWYSGAASKNSDGQFHSVVFGHHAITETPEPASLALMPAGLLAVAFLRFKR